MDDEKLQQFVERVSEVTRDGESRLTDDDFREIALDVGLSRRELEDARRAGEDALVRGREFKKREYWDDAIEQFRDAVVLLPGALEPRHELAAALAGRYAADGDESDADRAEQLARECLDIDPDFDGAYDVLESLDAAADRPTAGGRAGTASQTSDGSGGGGNRTTLRALAIGVTFLAASGVGAFWLSFGSSGGDGATGGADDTPVEAAPAPTVEPTDDEGSTTTADRGPRDIPVDAEDTTGRGLELEARRSILEVYSESNFYKLRGFAANNGETEIKKLRADIELLAADGTVVAKKSGARLLESYDARLRPGGREAFDVLVKSPEPAERARVTFVHAEGAPTAGDYPTPEPIEVTWDAPNPSRWTLRFAERVTSWKELEVGDKRGHLRATFEVTNESGRPVELLQTRLLSVDPDGERTRVSETYVVTTDGPALLDGETRAFGTVGSTSLDHDHYELAVVDVE